MGIQIRRQFKFLFFSAFLISLSVGTKAVEPSFRALALTQADQAACYRDGFVYEFPESDAVREVTIKNGFKVLVLAERGGQHEKFVIAALEWLNKLACEKNLEISVMNHANEIDEAILKRYKVIVQLNYAPYAWGDKAMHAFERYIDEGEGGWVGFHHASLLGEFDGYPIWPWFSDFLGGIRFKNYIAATASGTVNVEDNKHPVMKGLPKSFVIPDDEWYTYDIDPRPNVHVLATVDEQSYTPTSEIKMGDHPVIWINEKKKARNVYFQIGHSPSLLNSVEFKTMVSDAIEWAAGK